MTLLIIAVYLAGVLSIGVLSHHLFRDTGEDYFVATRTIGPFVLLMSLFGTHMAAFSLLGASGEAHRVGIGVFSLMASSAAIVVPAVFFFVGTRLWAIGKRMGFLTQVQFFRARFDSDGLGLLLFVVLVALVVPYLLIGVLGGGLTLSNITGGAVPSWVGGAPDLGGGPHLRHLRRAARHRLGQHLPDPGVHDPGGRHPVLHPAPARRHALCPRAGGCGPSRPDGARRQRLASEAPDLHPDPDVSGDVPPPLHSLAVGAADGDLPFPDRRLPDLPDHRLGAECHPRGARPHRLPGSRRGRRRAGC